MTRERVQRLTHGQKAALRLVLRHMTSKDIARDLNLSPHTVDKRLKDAMRLLNVSSRVEAAKLLHLHENGTPYQPLVDQLPDVEREAELAPIGPAASMPGSNGFDRAVLEDEERISFLVHPFPGVRAAEPVPEMPRRHNPLSPVARLGAIVVIAIGSALSFGAILGGLDALAELVAR